MTQNADHFETFAPHTLLKHAILETYLNRWAMKLLMWGRAGDIVYFVDAFAGAGKDDQGNPGSPLIAARIAAGTPAALAAQTGTRRGRMRVRAIEQNSRRHATLSKLLRPFNEQGDHVLATASLGVLAEHVDALVQEIGNAPTLYFLDPFGVKGLDAATYPRLLSGPHNEVFALFADMGATRLHGLVTAARPDVEGQIATLRASPSLFADHDAEREQAVLSAAAQKNKALDLSQAPSRTHLVRALGDEGIIAELSTLSPVERPAAVIGAFIRKLIGAGARYVVAIPMRNVDRHRVYSLVHASKSAKGFMAMKDAVSSGLKRDDLPAAMRERICEDLSVPLDPVVDQLRAEFAGRTDVPWTGGKGEEEGTVRRYVLESTPVFHFQANALRDALKTAGILRREKSGKLLCAFPPASA